MVEDIGRKLDQARLFLDVKLEPVSMVGPLWASTAFAASALILAYAVIMSPGLTLEHRSQTVETISAPNSASEKTQANMARIDLEDGKGSKATKIDEATPINKVDDFILSSDPQALSSSSKSK